MRLSVCTEVFTRFYSEEEILKMIKEAGFDCFDYSCYREYATAAPVLGDDYIERAHRLRELSEELSLPCNQSHTPFVINPGNYRPDMTDWRYRDLIRSIEAAAILGAPFTVVHALGTERDPGFWKNCVSFYKTLEPWCERFNIKIAVENLWSYDEKNGRIDDRRLSTPDKLNAMVRELGSPRFVELIDIGHAALTYGEPEDFILKVDPRLLKGLHVHDTDYRSDTHTLPFHGKQNWNAIMDSLAKIGYTGDLTYEVSEFFLGMRGDRELTLEALKYAERIGRRLISRFEKAKEN